MRQRLLITARGCAVFLTLLLIASCNTRPISNSGYNPNPGDRYAVQSGTSNPFYMGELSEFDVLGIDPAQKVSEEDIRNSFAAKQALSLPKGSSILLVQSGAKFPDDQMVRSLEKYYTVAAFNGVPTQNVSKPYQTSPYFMILRLAAAKGGYEKIIAYWGILEAARERLDTKAVSWFPFIGGAIPDENQRMRIRLKVAIIDVKSGQWEIFVPESFDDKSLSTGYSREASDQEQVELLKGKAYQVAAEDIVKRYAR